MVPRLALALLLVGCAAPPAPERAVHALRGEAFGTTWTVKWLGDAPITEADAEAAIVGALAEVDAAMSTWRDDSDLSRARAAQGPVTVRAETGLVVEAALVLARETGGAFDPTVQPLVELWGFHGTPRTTWPTDDEVASARAQLGYDRVRVVHDGQGGVTLDTAGTALDLSAIAKGHGVDRVSWALSDLGVSEHMVEVGGEVRAHGRGPGGVWWRVGVDLPSPSLKMGEALAAVVQVTNGAVATSGNYRQSFRVEGREVHHTMDPRTGFPAAARVGSATVIAPDCRTADGWATALMVLGADEGLRLIEGRPELEALVLVPDGEGFARRLSSGMARHLADDVPDASGPPTR